MRSRTPKVLHRIAGSAMLDHVIAAARSLDPERLLVVVGHGRERVAASLPADVLPVVQERQDGTGHAVRVALAATDPLKPDDVVVVMPGDAPLLTPATLAAMVERHHASRAVATLLTAELSDPTGYGRVVRDGGLVRAVVEQRDADAATAAVREVCTSVYAFTAGPLAAALARLNTDNAAGEEYLTDVVAMLVADGEAVAAHKTADAREAAGVNDRVQLAAAGIVLRDRIVNAAMLAGATVVDPATTWIDAEAVVEPDVTILPNTQLVGRTRIGGGATVGPDCTLTDTIVGAGATVRRTTADGAEIGPDATVGPYTHLRPGTRLGRGAKAGSFVETKAADLGDGAKVPHLAYVGDAEIGPRSNIGCGAVFVNYDGVTKHRTSIGADVRIGSATMLVAPLRVGDGVYTAAGTVVTQDVPAGALAISRARQANVEGWVERRRPGSPAAGAAGRARDAAGSPPEDGGGGEAGAAGTGAGAGVTGSAAPGSEASADAGSTGAAERGTRP
jgi:bifunctional UDP-N-acetylglucosamine pyrophosphorylase/glucosamine-1-phosphate N-acetyltransferase